MTTASSLDCHAAAAYGRTLTFAHSLRDSQTEQLEIPSLALNRDHGAGRADAFRGAH
jgi:hypothetical protein